MVLYVFAILCALFIHIQQVTSDDKCSCKMVNSEPAFPHGKLNTAGDNAAKCNSEITNRRTLELESLLLGLDRRLPQLEEDVSVLEKEDDGQLYGALSLQVIENELKDIARLIEKLNSTTFGHKHLTTVATEQLKDLKAGMKELEEYDTLKVVEKQQVNRRLKRDLDQCRDGSHTVTQPTQPQHGYCPHGEFVNITGPRVYTAGEYPGSYKYGAWGQDPHPEEGKESWYWLVMLTSGNKHSNYIRLYTSLSSLIVGVSVPGNVQIHASNPTTNTIQGPNNVLYKGAFLAVSFPL